MRMTPLRGRDSNWISLEMEDFAVIDRVTSERRKRAHIFYPQMERKGDEQVPCALSIIVGVGLII